MYKLNSLLNEMVMTDFSHILLVGDFNCKGMNWELGMSYSSDNHADTIFLETIKDFVFIPTCKVSNENKRRIKSVSP